MDWTQQYEWRTHVTFGIHLAGVGSAWSWWVMAQLQLSQLHERGVSVCACTCALNLHANCGDKFDAVFSCQASYRGRLHDGALWVQILNANSVYLQEKVCSMVYAWYIHMERPSMHPINHSMQSRSSHVSKLYQSIAIMLWVNEILFQPQWPKHTWHKF